MERPTYNALKTLKKMIKANASSVISNLGGGLHSHLRLVVPDAEYNQITGYTYTNPTHPGELKIAENIPLHKAIIMQELHNEKLDFFMTPLQSKVQSRVISLQQLIPSILMNSKIAQQRQ